MKTLKFKTTITCGGCVAKVKPVLDSSQDVDSWKVDLESKEKLLTIESKSGNSEDVVAKLKEIGYTAELVKSGSFLGSIFK